ncbi:MAG: hypothetical protein AB7D57_11435 [Desulfovibrionaceae bacterium]
MGDGEVKMGETRSGVGPADGTGGLDGHPARGSGRIDSELLVDLVVRREWTQARAAEFFGVTAAAVSRALKRAQAAVNRDVAMRTAPVLLEAQVETGARFEALVQQAEKLLGMFKLVVEGDPYDAEVLQAKDRLRRLAGPKGNLADLAVKLMGEARKQVEFWFAVQSKIFDLRQVADFQRVVMEEIGKVDPELQRRIVARLTEVQAFRSTLDAGVGAGVGPGEN